MKLTLFRLMRFGETMFMEDLIAEFGVRISTATDRLGENLRGDSWTRKFIESLAFGGRPKVQIYQGAQTAPKAHQRPLSTEQARVFLNIVKRLRKTDLLESAGYRLSDIDAFLTSPRYRSPPYPSSNVPREVRYLGDNKLGFRCKRIDEIVHDIKELGHKGRDTSWKNYHMPVFNRQGRCWVVSVTKDTLSTIIKIIGEYDFACDDAVLEYLALADSSKGQASTFVFDPESQKIVANICDNEVLTGWIQHVIYGEML